MELFSIQKWPEFWQAGRHLCVCLVCRGHNRPVEGIQSRGRPRKRWLDYEKRRQRCISFDCGCRCGQFGSPMVLVEYGTKKLGPALITKKHLTIILRYDNDLGQTYDKVKIS